MKQNNRKSPVSCKKKREFKIIIDPNDFNDKIWYFCKNQSDTFSDENRTASLADDVLISRFLQKTEESSCIPFIGCICYRLPFSGQVTKNLNCASFRLCALAFKI